MMEYVQHLFDALERGRRFVTHDVWYIGKPGEEVPHGLIIKQVRVLILLVQNLLQGAFLLRAAALTFTTMLSIVPCIAIVFVIIQELNLGVDVMRLVDSIVAQSATEGALDAAQTAPSSAGVEDPNRQVMKRFLQWVFADLDTQGRAVDNGAVDPIEQVLDYAMQISLSDTQANSRAVGTVGLLIILATVFGLMWNIESAFNAIWGLRRTRSWFRILSDYMMIVLFIPFLVAGVLGVTIVLQNDPGRLGGFAFALRGVQYGVVWVAFSALYAFVPNTKVKWRYALLGGIIAGSLWCIASWAYLNLQIGVSKNSLIYSSFFLFPLLMTWIYVSWIIVLLGAELTFAYQNETTFAMERHAAGASHAYREAVGLRAMVEICRRFDAGMPGLSAAEAGKSWNVPTRLLNETLDTLEEAGLVRRCATEPVTFVPARSLDRITVGDVVWSLREAGREPSALREDEALRKLMDEIGGREAPLMKAGLEQVVRRFHPPRQALPAGQADDEALALVDANRNAPDAGNDVRAGTDMQNPT